jgi:hypothetical protein
MKIEQWKLNITYTRKRKSSIYKDYEVVFVVDIILALAETTRKY